MTQSEPITESITIHGKQFGPLIDAAAIKMEIARIAGEIADDYADKDPLVIAVLNGAFIFAADLVRAIPFDTDISFVKLASYRDFESTGKVAELLGLAENVTDRHVLIIEDIIDSGNTIAHLYQELKSKNAQSIEVAALLMKSQVYKGVVPIKYVGFEIGDEFVVGYGLDFNGLGRTLPGIYVVDE